MEIDTTYSTEEKLDAIISLLKESQNQVLIPFHNDSLFVTKIELKIRGEWPYLCQKLVNDGFAELLDINHLKLTHKGLYYKGYVKSSMWTEKWKEWFSKPDNAWKVIAFVGSPIISFLVGYWFGRH